MFAPETVAAVKERTDIVALIGENVRLRKRGRSHVGLCPFHHEKTPSFHVNAERGFFHCFGCGESGSAIDYLMKLEGLSFVEAVRNLADRAGIQAEESANDDEQREARRREQRRAQLFQVNETAAAYFEEQLRPGAHPLGRHGRAALEARGLQLGSPDATIQGALRAFRVGYAPWGWDGLAGRLRQRNISLATAEALGLVVARPGGSGHYDRFRHRLMFAVLDLQGRVTAFSGRALPEPSDDELEQAGLGRSLPTRSSEEPPAPPAKYINSPESPVYVKGEALFGLHQARHAVRQRDQAVLVEGNFDVLSLHARGLQNVVAPLGTAFTTPQAKLVGRYTRNLVLLFDGDAAGAKAVRAARKPVAEAGLLAKVAVPPTGTDPDDLARTRGIEAVEKLVGGARGLLDHLIDDALSGTSFEGGSLREKHERIRAVADLLSSESDPTLRSMAKAYADRISSQLVVAGRSPGDMRELERWITGALSGGSTEAEPARPESPSSLSRPQEMAIGPAILGAILDFPELLDDPDVMGAITELEDDAALGVAAVRQMWDPKKSLQASELLDLMPPAIHAFAANRLASPLFDAAAEARTELLDNAKKLRRRAWSRDKAQLVEALARAEGRGDSTAEDELLRELSRRSKRKLGLS
jgi:DNA primase